PDDADAWEHLGTWRALQGNTDEAIDAYKHSIQLDPNRITARFSLAETYLEAERYEEAMQVYQSLVEQGEDLQSDDLAAAYAGLADTYREVQRYAEALDAAQQAIALDPSLVLAYETLAQIYEEMGRPEEAAAARDQANALSVATE